MVRYASCKSAVVSRRGLFVTAAALVATAACGGDDREKPRQLTAGEAEQLALARFNLHQRGQVPVTMDWRGSPDASISAILDLDSALGFGTISTKKTDGVPAVSRYIGWNQAAIATAPLADGGGAPTREDWSTRALSTSVPQDIFLTLALTLGSDRPENPLLLRQGAARFLRRDRVRDVPVKVIQGPRPAGDERSSRTRYWLDKDGTLMRFQAYLGDRKGRFAQITFDEDRVEPAGLRASIESALPQSTNS